MIDNCNYKKWYILQVLSGSENKVEKYIYDYSKTLNISDLFDKIIIPKEDVIEIKNGKKKKSSRKIFPGYILINMIVNDKTLEVINKIKNIFGFIRSGIKLSSISENEVNIILDRMKLSFKNPKPKITFVIGEKIRVNNGPFSDFNGIIENIDYSKNKATVSISIFGRFTPIDLNFTQIEKLL